MVPIQAQFESLTLNTPLQPPVGTDLSQQQFGSVQTNNESSNTQETVDDNDPTGDLALINDDGTRGMLN
jgi:hypothetical protein